MIRTNNQPREMIGWNDLTKREQAEFDYLTDDAERESVLFVRYKNWVYELGQIMRVPKGGDLAREGWHGYTSDTAFSATVFKFVNDCDNVVCGQFFSD